MSPLFRLGLAAGCLTATVLTPSLTAPPAAQFTGVQLTSVTQPLDVLDQIAASIPGLDTTVLDPAVIDAAAAIPEAAGFITTPLYSLAYSVVTFPLSLVTGVINWVPFVGSLASQII